MKVLVVYARLYASCFRQALKGIGNNLWTLLLPMVLVWALSLLTPIAASVPLLGGFIVYLVGAAAVSCYLYFVGEVVDRSKVSLAEFRQSIGKYFWSVVNLGFVLWIVGLVLGFTVGRSPNGGMILLFVTLAELILLNASPEVIYQRGTYGGLATVQSSLQFIQENWIEWFLPNVAFGAVFYLAWVALAGRGLLGGLAFALATGAFLHLTMVFRGHLFQALATSSHRQRMFKYRNAA